MALKHTLCDHNTTHHTLGVTIITLTDKAEESVTMKIDSN